MGAILVRDLPKGPYRDVLLLAQVRAERYLGNIRMDGASTLVIGMASFVAESIGTQVFVNGEPRYLVGSSVGYEDLAALAGDGPGTYTVSCFDATGYVAVLPGSKHKIVPNCSFTVTKAVEVKTP